MFERLIGLTLLGLAAVAAGPLNALAQAPSDICLSPDDIIDGDVAALRVELSDPTLCVQTRQLLVDAIPVQFTVIRNVRQPGPLWAVPHDEEDAAFAAGVYAVRRYGGTMVAVENAEQRMIGALDPNRIFAATQAAALSCGIGQVPAAFIGAFIGEWNRDYPVVGLHNNWDGFVEAGGKGTISVRRPDEKMIPFPSPVAEGRLADEDTIAMLVSLLPPAENTAGREAIRWFNDRGVHVVYRYVTEANNDCTLADYLTLNHLGAYFNLEAESGDAVTQLILVDRLMAFVHSEAYRGAM
jgi:hypothetical protein